MNLRSLGELVRTRRTELGLSQAQLGHLCHLSRTTINLLENGTLSDLGVVEDDGRVLVENARSLKLPQLWLAGYGDWTGPGSATLMGAARTARGIAGSLAGAVASGAPPMPTL